MGVKSTVTLARDVAIERYVELALPNARRLLRAQAVALSNKQLEDTLEKMNDERAGGEGFENYIVTGSD